MLNYLNLIILVIAFIILTIFLFIMGHHLIIYWREKRLNKKQKEWEPVLYQYLGDEIKLEEVVEQIEGDFHNLWHFLEPYCNNLSGEDFQKLRYFAIQSGMITYFKQELKEKNNKRKVRAALVLGKLQEESALPFLKEMLESDEMEVLIAAIKAIAEIGDLSLIITILKRMFNFTYFTFEGMMELLVLFDNEICKPLKALLHEREAGVRDFEETFGVAEEQVLALIIDLLGYYRHFEVIKYLENLLKESESEEVIIHIFKALARMEMPVDVDLSPFLISESWVIKSQAAKYIATVRDKKYVAEIKNLLTDDNWWVRYHAARALFNLGEVDLLERIATNDDIAANMSRYILSLENK